MKKVTPRKQLSWVDSLSRTLVILDTVAMNIGPSVLELAAICDCDIPTIQKDIAIMKKLGAPIVYERDPGGYYLTSNWDILEAVRQACKIRKRLKRQ